MPQVVSARPCINTCWLMLQQRMCAFLTQQLREHDDLRW
jgi:hypothetical protein